MPITPKQRQHLKGLGHSLKTVIIIGKEGLSEGIVKALGKALDDHELIKVRLLETAELDKKEAAAEIAQKLGAELVQIVGFKITIYRANKKEPKIKLP